MVTFGCQFVLQNAGKFISATVECQKFPGEHPPLTPLEDKAQTALQPDARLSNPDALLLQILMKPLSAIVLLLYYNSPAVAMDTRRFCYF